MALGLGRFAYALLLPSMRLELRWSFAIAGAMNTANAFGYLAGALLAAPAARRLGMRGSFLGGLAVTVASLLATAATGNTAVLVALRALVGVSGAICFVTGAGLVAEAGTTGSARRAASLLAIYFAGGGAGIAVSGLAIPFLLASTPVASGWRWAWVLLAGLGLLALALATPAARASREPPTAPTADRRWPARRFRALFVSYALFGAGYIAYMTFIVAFLKGRGAGPGEITVFWVVLGAASVTGAFLWVRPLVRLRGGRAPGMVLGVVSVGALLPLVSSSPEAVMGSAALFGGSFLAVVTAVTMVTRRSLRPHHWTPAIASLTVAFALGQCAGPVLAGVLSDGPAGLRAGLGLSAAVLVVGALIALTQRHYEISAGDPLPAVGPTGRETDRW
ncbi:MAG: YbfB/YjiJ family MFS transporter [Candidatus Dormibacteraeota bacterium]|nr:YbfB/YjiJ family MFS transporter [Candidatus Dormibacteraeota bacterium]